MRAFPFCWDTSNPKNPTMVMLSLNFSSENAATSITVLVTTGSFAKWLIPEAKKRYTTKGSTNNTVSTMYFFTLRKLKIPRYKAVQHNVVYVVGFKKKNKNKVRNQYKQWQNNWACKASSLVAQVHEIPCDIVCFNDGENDKNPVEKFHSQKRIHQNLWLKNPKYYLNNGYDG